MIRRVSWSRICRLSTEARSLPSTSKSFFIESYGCAMNTSDSEIVASILIKAGHSQAKDISKAGIILVNTCAIRENAEAKIWHRLAYFQSLRNKKRSLDSSGGPLVGVLGCMAERLKDRLLDEESVDFVCGPDAYRDMPRLVEGFTSTGQKEANTRLSLEETYADIRPSRAADSSTAFVSIMRGCNNMCSYCIVPFTRGRERSRPLSSILEEVRALVDSSPSVREVCLLGQNVNGFHDASDESAKMYPETKYLAASGFTNLYNSRRRDAPGARFADLLAVVSDLSPELRIRFTSPHPKDFPDEVLHLIAERHNLCKSLHLPAQSGSSSVLHRMRRGYDREAYVQLFKRAKEIIPNVCISTDMITGFCGETEEEHRDTLSLMEECKFDQAFMFAYSTREKTHAHRTLEDDVPEVVKLRRLQEVIDVFRSNLMTKNRAAEGGQVRLVLVEGYSTRSTPAVPMLTGRTDGNKRVIFPQPKQLLLQRDRTVEQVLSEAYQSRTGDRVEGSASQAAGVEMRSTFDSLNGLIDQLPRDRVASLSASDSLVGKYVLVFVAEASGPTLRGAAVNIATNSEHFGLNRA